MIFLIATGANDTEENRKQHLQSITDSYLLANDALKKGAHQDPDFLEYKALQRKKALGGRFYEIEVLDKVEDLTDTEKRIAYARFNSKVHVRQLYFRTQAEALKVYDRLEEGEDFIDLANEVFQTAAYDSTAGDMGFVSYFSIDDALAEAAFQLNAKHEYTQPVRSREGYHILRLENKIISPIITESAYAAHGPGVGQEMRLRKIRIAGDTFVRSFMADLNHKVNRDAMMTLTQQIRSMVRPEEPEVQPFQLNQKEEITQSELNTVRQALTPETVLIEYEWNGTPRVFTAGDYFHWISDLPYAEIRTNPAASVGRALRNEVFSLAGEEAGLDEDSIVQQSIDFESKVYLASQVKQELRRDTTYKPTEEMVERAFERLARNRKKSVIVDYWTLTVNDAEEGKAILSQIENGQKEPGSIAGYSSYEEWDVQSDPEWMTHLRQAPLGKPFLVGLSGGRWSLLEVTRRDEQMYTLEDVRSSLEKQLAPFSGEYYLLQRLYGAAKIEVDANQITTNWLD